VVLRGCHARSVLGNIFVLVLYVVVTIGCSHSIVWIHYISLNENVVAEIDFLAVQGKSNM